MVGDSGTGKTSLLLRVTEDMFDESSQSTFGVDFVRMFSFYQLIHSFLKKKKKSTEINGKQIELRFWDTVGQERFRTISCSYFRNSQAVIIMYDITNTKSFENVKLWWNETNRYCLPTVLRVLVGSKADLSHLRSVSYQEGYNLAACLGVPFFEISSKKNENINELFQKIVTGLSRERISPLIPKNPNKKLKPFPKQQSSSCVLI